MTREEEIKNAANKYIENIDFSDYVKTDAYDAFIAGAEWADGNSDWSEEKVEPHTVGQFTGLHDKNGKEIYEGDIVKWTDEKDRMDKFLLCYVDWHKHLCKFYLSFGEEQKVNDSKADIFEMMRSGYNYEVIGNIYDATELLKGDEK